MKSNGEKLSEMILLHKDIMYNAVTIRHHTSTGNKFLHSLMKYCINAGCPQAVGVVINDTRYTNPLEGVILCSDLDFEDKKEMLDLFNNFIEDKNYGK